MANDNFFLVRTKSNHLLGPINRSKINELLRNKLLREDDEICYKNSFWFFVKEKDLFNDFIIEKIDPPSDYLDYLKMKESQKTAQENNYHIENEGIEEVTKEISIPQSIQENTKKSSSSFNFKEKISFFLQKNLNIILAIFILLATYLLYFNLSAIKKIFSNIELSSFLHQIPLSLAYAQDGISEQDNDKIVLKLPTLNIEKGSLFLTYDLNEGIKIKSKIKEEIIDENNCFQIQKANDLILYAYSSEKNFPLCSNNHPQQDIITSFIERPENIIQTEVNSVSKKGDYFYFYKKAILAAQKKKKGLVNYFFMEFASQDPIKLFFNPLLSNDQLKFIKSKKNNRLLEKYLGKEESNIWTIWKSIFHLEETPSSSIAISETSKKNIAYLWSLYLRQNNKKNDLLSFVDSIEKIKKSKQYWPGLISFYLSFSEEDKKLYKKNSKNPYFLYILNTALEKKDLNNFMRPQREIASLKEEKEYFQKQEVLWYQKMIKENKITPTSLYRLMALDQLNWDIF